jgi:phosphoenolpyruvate carboxykinase (ATP)
MVQDDHDPRDDYKVARTFEGTDACLKAGISPLGITGPSLVYRNLTFQELFDHEVANNEGFVAAADNGDTFTVDTGKFTGRSPKDKWIVREHLAPSRMPTWTGAR